METRVQWVRRLYNYDPLTGQVYSKKSGKPVGYRHGKYVRLACEGQYIYAHQVAFAIMWGIIPEEIDHEDLNGSNNIWDNIRPATQTENCCNCKKRSTNKSGLKGVSWSKSNNCWRMSIQYKLKSYFSYHATKESAYEAYCEMSKKLHGKFSNVG